MTVFAAQYLEYPPPDASPTDIRARLREACQRLPISLVLLGWDLPSHLEEAAAEETARQNASLFRWQPWLTGDALTSFPHEWGTVGPGGAPIPSFQDDPAFAFICPNHRGAMDFLLERLNRIAARGLYQGIFLDRIRFPSPAADPATHLGCFCPDCIHLAAAAGLDLETVRRYIQALPAEVLVRSLLAKPDDPTSPLEAFLDFREESITRTIQAAAQKARSLGLAVGLDCFSPVLTRMTGQNLPALDKACDWIKIMTYPRVHGPAGLPFELLGLANWLTNLGIPEPSALRCLAEASGLAIPATKAELRQAGLGSGTIAHEIECGRTLGVTRLLAGIALVEIKAVHESTPEQVQADLKAARAADGLVISWDLWQTPLERLDAIRSLWEI
ncbi:MAG: hypothetical protein IMZ62_06945 [Chloroflexi bacterium]|nr:hypothetical protein [Chloroflexota bacterium]